ncbi:ubiquitinyl hydrolase 1 [Plasmodiophora brassicae]|nr:hypothetical protein PBRA_006876 [Plasmodiophora brassicae]
MPFVDDLLGALGRRADEEASSGGVDEDGVALLVSVLPERVPASAARSLLVIAGGDHHVARAIVSQILAGDASNIAPVPGSNVRRAAMRHAVNSCYISALFCAAFLEHDAYDGAFLQAQAQVEKDHARKMTLVMINLLRTGVVVHEVLVDVYRDLLVRAGFATSSTRNAQQDAHELFVFLLDLLDAPLLAFHQTLHHAVDADTDDMTVKVERAIQLPVAGSAVPCPAPGGLSVKHLLDQYFFGNTIDGLRRRLHHSVTTVSALCTLTLAPYPTSPSPKRRPAPAHRDPSFMLPVLLLRYASGTSKDRTPVRLPEFIDATPYVLPSASSSASVDFQPATCRYVLVLRSVVCHLGCDTLQSGHYVAFASRRRPSRRWVRYDDMDAKASAREFASFAACVSACADELLHDAYLAFYELVDMADAAGAERTRILGDAQGQRDYALAIRMQERESAQSLDRQRDQDYLLAARLQAEELEQERAAAEAESAFSAAMDIDYI